MDTESGPTVSQSPAEAIHADYVARIATLTGRERETLLLMARDYTSPQIGSMLGISRSAVDTYRARLYAKLDVAGACGAAVVAAKVGLV